MPYWISKTALVTAGISILAVSPCAAQGEIVPAPATPDAAKTFNPFGSSRKVSSLIALRNVKPRLMAFWLDPKNHPAPPEFAPPSGRESPVPAKVSPQLPEGIDRIVVIDAQNALLVFGTEAGVGQLRRIIAFLDKTQRQVEVEAFLVSIPNANLTGIWADLAAQTQGVRLAMGLVGNDERQWLHGAIAGKRAQILALRHPTFINGTTQRFDFAPPAPRRKAPNPLLPEDFSSPMPVIPPPKGMAEMPGMWRRSAPEVAGAPQPFGAMRLEVTPTINSDNTLTLEGEISGLSTGSLRIIAVLSDDKSLGFALPPVAGAPDRAFVLLTPRLVRRAGDSSPTP